MHIEFTLTPPDGSTITGPIQGPGGYVGNGVLYIIAKHDTTEHDVTRCLRHVKHQLEAEQTRARLGRPMALYEPEPGHCCVKDHRAPYNQPDRLVDLRTAKITSVQLVK